MNKRTIISIPDEVLKEMEEIHIHGGGTGTSDDINLECPTYTYCNGTYCITECACEEPDQPEKNEP